MISRSLLVIGCILILHAAYSLQHYRSLVQDLIESSTGISIDVNDEAATIATSTTKTSSTITSPNVSYRIPPIDIYIELGLAFLVLLLSEFIRPGSSMPRAILIKGEKVQYSSSATKSPIIGAPYRSRDFDIYTTRKSKLQ